LIHLAKSAPGLDCIIV